MLASSVMEVGVVTLVTLAAPEIPAVRRARTVAQEEDVVRQRKSSFSEFRCRDHLVTHHRDNCVVSDGQEGCCPIGQTCSGAPTGCSLPGYDPCPGASYCCRTSPASAY